MFDENGTDCVGCRNRCRAATGAIRWQKTSDQSLEIGLSR